MMRKCRNYDGLMRAPTACAPRIVLVAAWERVTVPGVMAEPLSVPPRDPSFKNVPIYNLFTSWYTHACRYAIRGMTRNCT